MNLKRGGGDDQNAQYISLCFSSPSPEKGDPDPHQELVKLWTELAESGDPDSINKAHAVPIKLGLQMIYTRLMEHLTLN